MKTLKLGSREVGFGHPCYVVAEIGQNHNGSIEQAYALIDAAADAGCDAVKFQKRTLEVCIPPEQRDQMRDTPWGRLSYLDYRRRLEFESPDDWQQLAHAAAGHGMDWFVSCWDEQAVDFIEGIDYSPGQPPVAHKVASACLTDHALLTRITATGRPVILSTGMSTLEDVASALRTLRQAQQGSEPQVALLHCNSSYPCDARDVNLRAMTAMANGFEFVTGYSGHERGIQISLAAVALGATIIERHLTLDRTQWGTDHAASLEPAGMKRLVRDIRVIEAAMGDGSKRVTESEIPIMKKLRRVQSGA